MSADQPYPPLAPIPVGTTLDSLLKTPITNDGHGHVFVGKLEFASLREVNAFQALQTRLAASTNVATPEQLSTLNTLITTGNIPNSRLNPAPVGTKIDDLLKPSSATPDAQGYFHLGELRVHKDVYKQFEAAERGLAAKDPEAPAALYHLEHGAGQATISGVKDNDFTVGRHVFWDPSKGGIDTVSGMKAPPAATLLHEQIHALGGRVGDTLANIPRVDYDNLEEQRVIDGTERRLQDALGLKHRDSHRAELVPAPNVLDTQHLGTAQPPQFHVTTNGTERAVSPGYSQSGRVVGFDEANGTFTISVRGSETATYHVEELVNGVNRGDPIETLRDAASKKDVVTVSFDRNGVIGFTDPSQDARDAGVPQHEASPAPMAR